MCIVFLIIWLFRIYNFQMQLRIYVDEVFYSDIILKVFNFEIIPNFKFANPGSSTREFSIN